MNLLIVNDREKYFSEKRALATAQGQPVPFTPPAPIVPQGTFSDSQVLVGDKIKAILPGVFGGYLVKFTTEAQRDLVGDYFDGETDFQLTHFPVVGLKTLYGHGYDPGIGTVPVGSVVKAVVDGQGIYATTKLNYFDNFKAHLVSLIAPEQWKLEQLKMAESYQEMLLEMLNDGKLGWSSGALPASVHRSADGHIDRWAIIEASITPAPMMPYVTAVLPLRHFREESLSRPLKPRNLEGVAA